MDFHWFKFKYIYSCRVPVCKSAAVSVCGAVLLLEVVQTVTAHSWWAATQLSCMSVLGRLEIEFG